MFSEQTARCLLDFIGESRMKLREADKLDRKSRGSPSTALYPRLKAIEKSRFRPTYAGANMGHPDRAVIGVG